MYYCSGRVKRYFYSDTQRYAEIKMKSIVNYTPVITNLVSYPKVYPVQMFRAFASSYRFNLHVITCHPTDMSFVLTFSLQDRHLSGHHKYFVHTQYQPTAHDQFQYVTHRSNNTAYSVYIGTRNKQNYKIVTAKQPTAVHNFFYFAEVTSGNDTHNKNKSR